MSRDNTPHSSPQVLGLCAMSIITLAMSEASLSVGIHRAFLVDSGLAVCSLLVSLLFVDRHFEKGRWHTLVHHQRAHG